MSFSRKKKTQVHPTISLNDVQVERVSYKKHLGILLDEKLNFKQDIDSELFIVNLKTILRILLFLLL